LKLADEKLRRLLMSVNVTSDVAHEKP
jgi:hypothetical protein